MPAIKVRYSAADVSNRLSQWAKRIYEGSSTKNSTVNVGFATMHGTWKGLHNEVQKLYARIPDASTFFKTSPYVIEAAKEFSYSYLNHLIPLLGMGYTGMCALTAIASRLLKNPDRLATAWPKEYSIESAQDSLKKHDINLPTFPEYPHLDKNVQKLVGHVVSLSAAKQGEVTATATLKKAECVITITEKFYSGVKTTTYRFSANIKTLFTGEKTTPKYTETVSPLPSTISTDAKALYKNCTSKKTRQILASNLILSKKKQSDSLIHYHLSGISSKKKSIYFTIEKKSNTYFLTINNEVVFLDKKDEMIGRLFAIIVSSKVAMESFFVSKDAKKNQQRLLSNLKNQIV